MTMKLIFTICFLCGIGGVYGCMFQKTPDKRVPVITPPIKAPPDTMSPDGPSTTEADGPPDDILTDGSPPETTKTDGDVTRLVDGIYNTIMPDGTITTAADGPFDVKMPDSAVTKEASGHSHGITPDGAVTKAVDVHFDTTQEDHIPTAENFPSVVIMPDVSVATARAGSTGAKPDGPVTTAADGPTGVTTDVLISTEEDVPVDATPDVLITTAEDGSNGATPDGPVITAEDCPSDVIPDVLITTAEDVPTGPISDVDLGTLSEALLAADVNNVGDQVDVNLQGLTATHGTNDVAPNPLLKVPDSALSGPTFAALVALQDNYVADVKTHEQDDQAKQEERSDFLNAVMVTDIMKNTQEFLTKRGVISGELRSVLEEIWFTPYSRSTGGPLSSSGFEHNFIGELKGGKVSGFHNWVNFAQEEKTGNLNYKGYVHKSVSLNTKGLIIWPRFTWLTEPKPLGAIMVGVSPELELALYTVCFLVRPNQKCPLVMNGQHFNVQAWVYEFDGKRLVSGAYPEIV